jgi:hypothetical protein
MQTVVAKPRLAQRLNDDAANRVVNGPSGSVRPAISMVNAADPWKRKNLTACVRTRLYGPASRRLLVQCVVSTVLVIVGQVLISKPFEMLLIQRNYVIQHLAAATSNPALGDSVLPRAPDARANGFNAARLQKLDYIAAELGIPV